jgi:hypothetical protein
MRCLATGRLETAVIGCLLAGALLSSAALCGGQQADPSQVAPVALTNSQPVVSFAVSPDTLVSTPPVVALSFPHVVNPANTAFSIFVYFSYRSSDSASEKPNTPPEKVLVGNASLYPADRPGGFRLRASDAWAKLKAAKATEVRLVVEIKRIHPTKPWTQVELSVAPPEWQGEP